jgi:hypothetical protein
VLICARGRRFRQRKTSASCTPKTFDKYGVAVVLGGNLYHSDRKLQRPMGRQKIRATSTNKDKTGACLCELRLTLKIHSVDTAHGFIYLVNKGIPQHTFHPQPTEGELVELVQKGRTASTRTSRSQLNWMILQKVKDMLPLCTTAEAQQRLLAALCSVEKDMYAEATAKMTKSQRSALL